MNYPNIAVKKLISVYTINEVRLANVTLIEELDESDDG